jgi:DNA-binding transcriptional ArsR family regulator
VTDRFWHAVELLSHPIRRDILAYLEKHPGASVTELRENLGRPWTTLAYHLDTLEEANVLASDYEKIPHSYGHVYRVDAARLRELHAILREGIERVLLHD